MMRFYDICKLKVIHYKNLAQIMICMVSVFGVIYASTLSTSDVLSTKGMRSEYVNLMILMDNINMALKNIDKDIVNSRQNYVSSVKSGRLLDPSIKDGPFSGSLPLYIFDKSGRLLAQNATGSANPLSLLSAAELISPHLDSTEDNLRVSRPVSDPVSHEKFVLLSRPLQTPDGVFTGVIVAAFDLKSLSDQLAKYDLGLHGGIAIVGNDGAVRAGTGIYARDVGADIRRSALFKEYQHNKIGFADQSNDAAGIARTTAYSALERYDLALFITNDETEILQASRHSRLTTLISGVIISALAALLLFLIQRMSNNAVGGAQHHIVPQAEPLPREAPASPSYTDKNTDHAAQIIHLANHDPLTALGNRLYLQEELEKRLHSEREKTFLLHVINLDNFKSINNAYGPFLGDKLLKAVAKRLRFNLRHDDVIARLSGDEFAVLEAGKGDVAFAGALANRLCQVLRVPYVIDGQKFEVTASIGIAIYPQDGKSTEDLLKASGLAVYNTKTQSRGSYKFYNEAMRTAIDKKLELKDRLKKAIRNNYLEMHYQPIAAIDTLEPHGYEALMRWRDPQLGLISPGEFIPLAEETGLIIPMGAWAMVQSCRDIAQKSSTARVAINLSPVQFHKSDMVETVRMALAETGLQPERLELEITESMILQNDDVTLKRLQTLRDMGISLSIDDFGTGYSSLSYLQKYPIDRIKIDRSFVNGLSENSNSIDIIKAIVSISSALGLKTIAEGIETEHQLQVLREIGCHEVQGYYIARPKPIQDLAA